MRSSAEKRYESRIQTTGYKESCIINIIIIVNQSTVLVKPGRHQQRDLSRILPVKKMAHTLK